MKHENAWVTWLILVATLSPQILRANDSSNVERQVRAALKGNLVTLRTPTASTRLELNSNAQSLGTLSPAPWTTGGLLRVREVRLKQDLLNIDCERVLVALRAGKAPGTPSLVPLLTGKQMSIILHLAAVPSEAAQITALLSQVFEPIDLEQRTANYWQPAQGTTPEPGTIVGTLEGGRPVYKSNRGVVEPPKPEYAPDPEYTQSARQRRVQGTAVLMVIVNEKGFPEILEVTKDLGAGLDLRALAAVAEWRFKPATYNNEPVAVMINVEVSFRMY